MPAYSFQPLGRTVHFARHERVRTDGAPLHHFTGKSWPVPSTRSPSSATSETTPKFAQPHRGRGSESCLWRPTAASRIVQGQQQDRTEWHRLTLFGRLVDVVEQWVKKGDRLYVEGRLEYSQTQDDQGGTRYWTDIVVNEMIMLGSGGPTGGSAPSSGGYGGPPPSGGGVTEPDDDLPF